MSKRLFVCVSGGVVHEVIVPLETNGTWTVIDWDNIESDPAREWASSMRRTERTLRQVILTIMRSSLLNWRNKLQ